MLTPKCSSATDPLWHKNYLRLVRNKEQEDGESGHAEPEYRLPPAIAGGILVPVGLFWCALSGIVSKVANRKLTSAQVCLDYICVYTLDR